MEKRCGCIETMCTLEYPPECQITRYCQEHHPNTALQKYRWRKILRQLEPK